MGMFPPTSGKRAFQYFHKETPITIDHAKGLEMVRLETNLRNSKYYQDMYSEKDDLDHFESVTVLIQKQVLKQSGYVDDVDSMNALRNLRSEFCQDDKFKDASVYFKYDRTFVGDLVETRKYPVCKLVELSGEKTTLNKLINPEFPTFVLAGSYS